MLTVWFLLTMKVCLFPVLLFLYLVGMYSDPALREIVAVLRDMYFLSHPDSQPQYYPLFLLFGAFITVFLVILYVPMMWIAYGFGIMEYFGGLEWILWVIPAGFVGILLGTKLSSIVLTAIDEKLGLDNVMTAPLNAYLVIGGVYMGIKAAKGVRTIITKI